MMRFNHMEITVSPGFVAEHGEDLYRFLHEVLGFAPSVFPGLDFPSLVVKTDPEASQFLFIAENEQPLARASDDHLGLHLDSDAEVEAVLAAAEAFKATDDRVEIRDLGMLELEATTTRAIYVRYLLPIWFDVQHIAHRPGHEPAREWRFAPAAQTA